MDTAEKLIAIAENEKKVYDEGKAYAYNNPQTPTDSRTSMYGWLAYLNASLDWIWDDYPDHSPSTDESCWIESMEYPKGTSHVTNFNQCFTTFSWIDMEWAYGLNAAYIRKYIGRLDMSSALKTNYLFGLNSIVEDAGTIILPKSPETDIQKMLSDLPRLEKVRVEGKIYRSIDVKDSPLDLESAKSIIYALESYAETNYDFMFSVTFSNATKALLDEAGPIFNGYMWYSYLSNFGWMY